MKKNITRLLGALVGSAIFAIGLTSSASAANIYPDVIFGTGNGNGGFTVGTNNNIEVGLRAKQRFPAADIFNYDGTDTYNFQAGESSPGSGRPLWNFEWSVNTDVSGTSGATVGNFLYRLKLDTDPGAGQTFTSFDPIMGFPFVLGADHAFGDNNTGNSAGTEGNPLNYGTMLSTMNVVQNSWAFSWYAAIDPTIAGLYRIELEVLNQSMEILSSSGINVAVSVVPLPAALPLYGAGVALLGFLGWRRKRASS